MRFIGTSFLYLRSAANNLMNESLSLVEINRDRYFFLSSKQLHMKVCKRIPLECVNKCGAKDIPREEVSDITRARKYLYSPCDVNNRQLIPGKTGWRLF